MSNGFPARTPSTPRSRGSPGASYIVTGGLGGIGMVVARWLVDSGAGRVVLNGRTEPSEEQRKVLAELESRAEIVVVPGDISAPGVAERLVARPKRPDWRCGESCTARR